MKTCKAEKDIRLQSFKAMFDFCFLKFTTWKQGRDILASEEGLQLIKVFTPHVIKILS